MGASGCRQSGPSRTTEMSPLRKLCAFEYRQFPLFSTVYFLDRSSVHNTEHYCLDGHLALEDGFLGGKFGGFDTKKDFIQAWSGENENAVDRQRYQTPQDKHLVNSTDAPTADPQQGGNQQEGPPRSNHTIITGLRAFCTLGCCMSKLLQYESDVPCRNHATGLHGISALCTPRFRACCGARGISILLRRHDAATTS